MIVFDLEWNTGPYGGAFPEIIQIGAVKLDRAAGMITDTFSIYIKPQKHKKINKNILHVAALEEAQASEITFSEAFGLFSAWCGDDSEFGTWGNDDFKVLHENIKYYSLPDALPEGYCNLQSAFSSVAGASGQLALYKAAEYCGIPDSFTFHDAVNDSMYTSLVSLMLPDSALEGAYSVVDISDIPTSLMLCRHSYTRFKSKNQLLNSRKCRTATCPRCGKIMRIAQWKTADGKHYHTRFSCPKHGVFALCLDVTAASGGTYTGKTYVVARGRKTEQLFSRGAGETEFTCKKLTRRRKPKAEKAAVSSQQAAKEDIAV